MMGGSRSKAKMASPMKWTVVVCLAFVAASFGGAEAEGLESQRELGEGVMMGGDDLSKLSYLMSTSNSEALQSMLGSLPTTAAATSLGSLGPKAAELKKLAPVAAKLAAIAAMPKQIPGKDGPDGKEGPVGAKGITGPVGPQGKKGDAGAKGSPGVNGAPSGRAGPQGLDGPRGNAGDRGNQGAKGPEGES